MIGSNCPSCAEKDARIKELEEELAKWKVATDWAKELSETRELIARAEKAEADNDRLREAIRWAIRQAEMPAEPSLGLTQYTRYQEPILYREEFIAEFRKRSGME